jgi:hypothetical protein
MDSGTTDMVSRIERQNDQSAAQVWLDIARAERDVARRQATALRAALEAVEYTDIQECGKPEHFICAACGFWPGHGHRPECIVGRALGRKDVK